MRSTPLLEGARDTAGGAATLIIADHHRETCPNSSTCRRWLACDECGPYCRRCWRSLSRARTYFEGVHHD